MLVSWMLITAFGIIFQTLLFSFYFAEIFDAHDGVMPMIEIIVIVVFVLLTGKI